MSNTFVYSATRGSSGYSGLTGNTGVQGAQGTSGYSGFSGISGANATTVSVTYSNSFTAGQAIYRITGGYALGQANSVSAADILGVVTSSTGTAFTYVANGYATGFTGLVDATNYYLSETTAGALTTNPPSAVGMVIKPVLIAIGSTAAQIVEYPGAQVQPAGSNSGYSGFSGLNGSTGAQGATGTTGAQGAAGTTGAQGAQGTAGTNGIQGAQGASGYSGFSGAFAGTGTSGYGAMFTGTNSLSANSFFFLAGNVGIGTTSPAANLEVAGAAPTIKITANNGTLAALQLTQTGVGNWLKYFRVSDSAFVEQYGGTDLLFLSTSGNLGLGVTPSASSGGGNFNLSGDIVGGSAVTLGTNWYFNAGFKYKATGTASRFYLDNTGGFSWTTAPSGTAGNAISFTQAMTLDASGNLLVNSTSALSGGDSSLYVNGSILSNYGNAMLCANSVEGYTQYNLYYSGTDRIRNTGYAGRFAFNLANGYLAYYVSTGTVAGVGASMTEKLRIDAAGNVGINTTAPYAKLNVGGSGSALSGNGVIVGTINQSLSTSVAIGAETGRYEIAFPTWRDITPNQIGAKIAAIRLNNYAANNAAVQSTNLAFFTGTGGGDGTYTLQDTSVERMRIDQNGNVGIGTSSPAYTLDLSGSARIVTSLGVGTTPSGTTGEIRATGNITAYYSDDRLKTKLGVIENALDKICSLEGFYYEANETAQALGYEPVREVGISAQATQKVLPEIVAPAPIDEKYLTVRYERLAPLLIEAIKELREENKLLREEIKTLK